MNNLIEPPLYFAPNDVRAISFHPYQNILLGGLIDGNLEILKYTPQDVIMLKTLNTVHRESIRNICFNKSGDLAASCGADSRITLIDGEGTVKTIIKKAHLDQKGLKRGINRVLFAEDQILISGDDDGMIKIWDLRVKDSVFEAEEQPGTIVGLHYDADTHALLGCCSDGTVAIYDIKQSSDSGQKLYQISDSVDEQLYSMAVVKQGRYIVCSSSENSLVIFKQNNIQKYVDRLTGLPGATPALLKLDENTLLAGSEDGFIRGVSIYPNSILDDIGQHEEDEQFSIESLAISHCGNIIASTSHDASINFFDISTFVMNRKAIKMEEKFEKYREELNAEELDALQESMLSQEGKMEEEKLPKDEMSESSQSDRPKRKGKKINLKEQATLMKKTNQRQFFKGL